MVARLARGPAYELLEMLYNLPATVRLAREAAGFRPHLLYERYSLATVAGILAARRAGIPHILEVNAPLAAEKRRWGRLWMPGAAERLEGWIFRAADRVVTVTGVLARIVERRGVPRERIRVIPNGADETAFHPELRGSEVRGRYGLEGNVVLGFVGWFRPWHGLEGVVRALASPGLRGLPVRLLLVGDGPARPGIEEAARRAGVAERVVVTGAVSRRALPEHVAAFDIALQPAATPYACPMKIPEYLAAGKPVVAPDQENIRELVRDGREGLLFPAGEVGALAKAVALLARDGPLRERLGRNARARLEREGLLWTRNADRVAGLACEIREEALRGYRRGPEKGGGGG